MRSILVAALLVWSLACSAWAGETITVQSTTSTQNSGLLDVIFPLFTAETGINVRVVAVGTGQALANARRGDADVVLVHARALEDQFVAQGWGINRKDLMYNDFVLIGPADDPASLATATSAKEALRQIADTQSTFVSRGDNSGTHVKELALWRAIGRDPTPQSGTWYYEVGAGMGTTINVAVETEGYTLTDRGTWISFGNKRDHRILFQGDPELFNQYGVMLVNPDRHPHVKAKAGQALIDWLTGPAGQRAIAAFKLGGAQLFFPTASN